MKRFKYVHPAGGNEYTSVKISPDELEKIVTSAVALAKEGRRLAGRPDGYVALDIGPTGRLLKPMGDLDFEEAVSVFAETVRLGAAAGWYASLGTAGHWPGMPHHFAVPWAVVIEGAAGAVVFALVVAVPTAAWIVGGARRRAGRGK